MIIGRQFVSFNVIYFQALFISLSICLHNALESHRSISPGSGFVYIFYPPPPPALNTMGTGLPLLLSGKDRGNDTWQLSISYIILSSSTFNIFRKCFFFISLNTKACIYIFSRIFNSTKNPCKIFIKPQELVLFACYGIF